jgi:hypothetical protein
MLGLALLLTGRAWAEVLTAGAGAVVALGLVVFAVNVLFNVKEPA